MSRVLERCIWTTESYIPLPWLQGGFAHLRAALSKVIPIGENDFERELLMAPNASTIAIDWYDHPEDIVKTRHGVVVLFAHALNGEIIQYLVSSIRKKVSAHRLSLCVVTVQGSNGVALSSLQTGLGFSFIIEYKAVTERINQHLGSSFPKAAVACSLGGIPVAEFMDQEKTGYSSVVLISCPLDLGKFLTDENDVTDFLLTNGKQVLKENTEAMTAADVDNFSKASDTSSLNDFLKFTICKQTMLSNILRAVDPYERLQSMNKPTLLMYALDDESNDFSSNVDLIRLCRNPNIAVAVTETGGHCGFQSFTPDWLGECVCEFASSASKPVL
jgi:predicted alpha/beta-fold hydrolase